MDPTTPNQCPEGYTFPAWNIWKTSGKHLEYIWKTHAILEMFVYDFSRPGQALQDRQPFFRSPRVLPRNEYELMP